MPEFFFILTKVRSPEKKFFKEISNLRFQVNLSSWRCADMCSQTDRWTNRNTGREITCLIIWFSFTWNENFYIDLKSPAKAELLHVKIRYFRVILTQFVVFCVEFRKSFQYEISLKAIHWDPRWYIWTEGQTA